MLDYVVRIMGRGEVVSRERRREEKRAGRECWCKCFDVGDGKLQFAKAYECRMWQELLA